MKVSDLLSDLEKGDRAMEHLTAKTPEGIFPPGTIFLATNSQRNQMRMTNQGLLQSQLGNYLGGGLQNSAFGMQNVGLGGSPWNR